MEDGHLLPQKGVSKNNLKHRRRMHVYEANSLSCALAAIRDGKLSLSAAARLHNVPKSTLRSRLQSKHPLRPATGGAEPALVPEQEKDIVLWLTARHTIGATVGWPELAETVRSVAISRNDASRSMKPRKDPGFGDKLPTYGWLLRFKRRHSNVPVLRTKQEAWFAPQLFSLEVMDEWIRKLYLYLQRRNINLFNLFKHSQYESLFYLGCLKFVSKKSLKYSKQFEVIVNSQTLNQCKLQQMLICYSASGRHIKPVLCFGAGVEPQIVQSLKDGPVFDVLIIDECATNNTFLSWLKLFIEQFNKNTVKPMLLLLDITLACISMEAFRLAEDNGIILFCFPLHSECEQPGKFGVMNQIREALMNCNDNIDVSQFKLLSRIQEVWQSHSKPQNAINSFLETGLVPLRETYIVSLKGISNFDQIAQTQGKDVTSGASTDFIMGMEQALQIIEEKCVAKEYLPLYREFYSQGSMPNSDPVFNIWKTLTMEIETVKKSMLPPLLASAATQTNYGSVTPTMLCSDSSAPGPSQPSSGATSIDTDVPSRGSVPISDRYRREFNFDAMPALNLEQHALEIMEKYKSSIYNADLEQLVIDDVTDFGGTSQ